MSEKAQKKRKFNLLKQILPEIFTENKIDIHQLKNFFGEHFFVNEKNTYEISWNGKNECLNFTKKRNSLTLIPEIDKSLHFFETKNIFIEGENLEVLKILQKPYCEKVKMIYIDPPYNTRKNDFVYNDNFFDKKNKDFHSNWLSMMFPRLILAKNLLKNDGVMFISIDDNEVFNLRMILNEILGEENFVAEFVWTTKKGGQGIPTSNLLVKNHEYILCYAKNFENFKFKGINRTEEGFSNPDNDPRGLWKRQYLQRFGQHFSEKTIVNPENNMKFTFPTPYTQENLEKWISENRIIFPTNPQKYPIRKEFFNEYKNNKQLVTYLDLHSTKASTEKLYEIFENIKIFTNPKPDSLIKFLIHAVNFEKNDIILDFFAGSGTTAHAVLELNNEDNIERNFICVQLDENCDKNSEAYKNGYEKISEITCERIKRVAKKYKNIGFRSYKLEKSNLKKFKNEFSQKNFTDISEKTKFFEKILVEVMLKLGFSLTAKVEKHQNFYFLSEFQKIFCFEKFNFDICNEIIEKKPVEMFVFDSNFEKNKEIFEKNNIKIIVL